MTDHYDTEIAQMRDSLAGAKIMAETNWMFAADVEALEREIAALEREAAAWRALTPAQQAEIIAAWEAKWAALEDTEDEDEDEDEDDD